MTKYVRPTAVPRLIGDTTKFNKLTNWSPKLDIDDNIGRYFRLLAKFC